MLVQMSCTHKLFSFLWFLQMTFDCVFDTNVAWTWCSQSKWAHLMFFGRKESHILIHKADYLAVYLSPLISLSWQFFLLNGAWCPLHIFFFEGNVVTWKQASFYSSGHRGEKSLGHKGFGAQKRMHFWKVHYLPLITWGAVYSAPTS